MYEIFNGFFSFDAKFWKTIIPLLIKPGSVSLNYVEGKRNRYSNPFRFYLSVSITFFLILGITKSVDKFKELKNGDVKKESSLISIGGFDKNIKKINIDSLNVENQDLNDSWTPIDSIERKEIIDIIVEEEKDTAKTININSITLFGFRIDHFIKHHRKYPKMNVNEALDSLKQEKTFFNRFLYNRAQIIYSFSDKDENLKQFLSNILSYGSVALFVFLPIFTLFLKLYYIRRKYTYVNHLIFVFHIQTVFFMLLSINFLLQLFSLKPNILVFVSLFLLYLFIAMKKFYQQGFFKTFFKFILLNFSYLIISSIGILIVFLISFTLY